MSFFKKIGLPLLTGMVLLALVAVGTTACNLLPNKAGIASAKPVAHVGDKTISFGQWMRQVDLYRVFAPQTVDPQDPATVKEVLDSLVDQEIVMGAIQKENYKNEAFEKEIKGELEKARQELETIRVKLERDLASVQRLQKTYKDDYYAMRLAQVYAEANVDGIIVTEKEKRDRYEQYKQDALKMNQKPREYKLVEPQIELRLKADNLLKKLQADRKISREEDVIQKYLGTLTPAK